MVMRQTQLLQPGQTTAAAAGEAKFYAHPSQSLQQIHTEQLLKFANTTLPQPARWHWFVDEACDLRSVSMS